jgi:hypothetical protein
MFFAGSFNHEGQGENIDENPDIGRNAAYLCDTRWNNDS